MSNDLLNALDTGQRRAVDNVCEVVQSIWSRPLHRYYTDHTVAHSKRIISFLNGLTAGMMSTDRRLSSTEILVLLTASYLHDIGMQNEKFRDGDPDQIRDHHNELTAEMIYAVFENPVDALAIPLTRDPAIVDAIALVAKGHRKVDLADSEYEPLAHGSEMVRLRLLAALLRFGDELDIGFQRVDMEMLKLWDLPLESQLHWWKCYYVGGVSIEDEDIRISYRFPLDRTDYEKIIVPLVEKEIRAKHAALEAIFRANKIKVALKTPQVRPMRLVQPLPQEVEALARKKLMPASEQVNVHEIDIFPKTKTRVRQAESQTKYPAANAISPSSGANLSHNKASGSTHGISALMDTATLYPFIYGRPVQPTEFLNRENELRTIFNRMRTGQFTAVTGGPHIGKTSLLLKLADKATQRLYLGDDAQELIVSHLDLRYTSNDFTPTIFWEKALSPLQHLGHTAIMQQVNQAARAGYTGDAWEKLFDYLDRRKRRLVLLLDNFDRLVSHPNFQDSTFFATLRSLNLYLSFSLVTASRFSLTKLSERVNRLPGDQSPLFNTLMEERLPLFDEATTNVLLERAGDAFSLNDRRFIRRVAGRHPYLLQAMAAFLLETTGTDRYARACERFYNWISASHHFDDLWQMLDDRSRTAAVILSLAELGNRVSGQQDNDSGITRVNTLGFELRRMAANELVEQVDRDWQFDKQYLPYWGQEQWTIGIQSFTWWIYDMVATGVQAVPSYEEWLMNNRHRTLLTQDQWDRLVERVRNAPQLETQWIKALARSLYDELPRKD